MDQVSQAVLALLRGALWGEEAVYPADTDWQAVTKELQAQAIMGVIAGSDIPECVPAQTRAQWESLALLQGARFYQLLHQQDQLLALLSRGWPQPYIIPRLKCAPWETWIFWCQGIRWKKLMH